MAGVEAGKLIRREVRVAGGEPRTVLKDAGSKCNTFSGWHHSLIHDKVPLPLTAQSALTSVTG